MRRLLFLTLCSLSLVSLSAQTIPTRHLHSKIIIGDSVEIFFNRFYELTEPGCADIIRYGHMDLKHRRFVGKFKDVSKSDTTLVVAEGNYSADGLKNGEFVIRYLNGDLQAQGYFKNGNYHGKWTFYSGGHIVETANFINGYYDGDFVIFYPNGSPQTHMRIRGYNCEILDAWNFKGEKIVDNGNGDYALYTGGLNWGGNILNGLPDGFWGFQVSDKVFGSELFNKGKFIKGHNQSILSNKEYEDKSRINFMPTKPKLDIADAGQLFLDHRSDCDTTRYIKEGQIIKYKYQIFD